MGNAANGLKGLFYKTTKIQIENKEDCLAWEIDLTGLKRISIEKVDDGVEVYLYNGATDRFDPISFGSVMIEEKHRLFAVRCNCEGLLNDNRFSGRLSTVCRNTVRQEDGSVRRVETQYLLNGTFSYGTVINPFNFIFNYKDKIKVGKPFYGDLLEETETQLNIRQEFFNTVFPDLKKFLDEKTETRKKVLSNEELDELIIEANEYIKARFEENFNKAPKKGWNEKIECKVKEIKKIRITDANRGASAR